MSFHHGLAFSLRGLADTVQRLRSLPILLTDFLVPPDATTPMGNIEMTYGNLSLNYTVPSIRISYRMTVCSALCSYS